MKIKQDMNKLKMGLMGKSSWKKLEKASLLI